MPKTRVGNHISGQLVRCGTSPAPNYGEAQSAESRADFIHKMKVCLKELRETRVWLMIIVRAELIKPVSKLNSLIQETNELISIFVSSIRTAKLDIRIESTGLSIFYILRFSFLLVLPIPPNGCPLIHKRLYSFLCIFCRQAHGHGLFGKIHGIAV